jgi:hypothetical protein
LIRSVGHMNIHISSHVLVGVAAITVETRKRALQGGPESLSHIFTVVSHIGIEYAVGMRLPAALDDIGVVAAAVAAVMCGCVTPKSSSGATVLGMCSVVVSFSFLKSARHF